MIYKMICESKYITSISRKSFHCFSDISEDCLKEESDTWKRNGYLQDKRRQDETVKVFQAHQKWVHENENEIKHVFEVTKFGEYRLKREVIDEIWWKHEECSYQAKFF